MMMLGAQRVVTASSTIFRVVELAMREGGETIEDNEDIWMDGWMD